MKFGILCFIYFFTAICVYSAPPKVTRSTYENAVVKYANSESPETFGNLVNTLIVASYHYDIEEDYLHYCDVSLAMVQKNNAEYFNSFIKLINSMKQCVGVEKRYNYLSNLGEKTSQFSEINNVVTQALDEAKSCYAYMGNGSLQIKYADTIDAYMDGLYDYLDFLLKHGQNFHPRGVVIYKASRLLDVIEEDSSSIRYLYAQYQLAWLEDKDPSKYYDALVGSFPNSKEAIDIAEKSTILMSRLPANLKAEGTLSSYPANKEKEQVKVYAFDPWMVHKRIVEIAEENNVNFRSVEEIRRSKTDLQAAILEMKEREKGGQ